MTDVRFSYNLPGAENHGLSPVDRDASHFTHFEEDDNIPNPVRAILEDVAHLGIHVGEEGSFTSRTSESGVGKATFHPGREVIHYGTGGFDSRRPYQDIGRAVMASAGTRDDIELEYRHGNPGSGIQVVSYE